MQELSTDTPAGAGTTDPAKATGTAATPGPAEKLSTDIVAGPGGVMTDEVGVVTGELTLATAVDKDHTAVVRVQYKGADEWYVVTGARTPLTCVDDAKAVHSIAVGLLNRPDG